MSPVVPTAYASRSPSSSAAQRRGFLTQVTKVLIAPFRVWRNRRSAASLMHLDARLLADIGLTHTDVARTLRQPTLNPSADLQRLAEERRAAARAAAEGRLADALGIPLG